MSITTVPPPFGPNEGTDPRVTEINTSVPSGTAGPNGVYNPQLPQVVLYDYATKPVIVPAPEYVNQFNEIVIDVNTIAVNTAATQTFVPASNSITLILTPDSASSAKFQLSFSPVSYIEQDINAADPVTGIADVSATWVDWTPGTVSTTTEATLTIVPTAIRVVLVSGTSADGRVRWLVNR